MLNNVYRLTGVRQIERVSVNMSINQPNTVIVRPTLMSLCRADERYYTGMRDQKILAQRLPMALVHESVGEVVRDTSNTFKPGTLVAMIPTHAHGHDKLVSDNYLRSSTFRSSTEDGFMREYVAMEPENLIEIPQEAKSNMNAFFEVVSVAVQAIHRLKETMINRSDKIGIWGDGNVAYITAVVARELFPDSELFVFGKHQEKLDYISFAKTLQINDIPEDLVIDQAIEVVGGQGSKSAIEQIIKYIKPRGTIVLSGVSENPVAINTRMVLEKGLSLVGTTRSTREDFQTAIDMVANSDAAKNRLEVMVPEVQEVRTIQDITDAFDDDLTKNWGKTVLDWKM
ncbi:zinc-binding dehydrogenase [Weissella ceti]|uniref:Zinc-binding dehydrogenase n=1 Tax=Weissella ceti TaxID=759620 RepID=A0ABT3E3B5_9LACO|nr:zinc-binding dehydrogenase [Weissella ceti]MCW0952908.1 zinc-binding dehydrogenase [Weissella ceti]QVK11455.1 zinc-binding dehydrogenase [Weissella ceti]